MARPRESIELRSRPVAAHRGGHERDALSRDPGPGTRDQGRGIRNTSNLRIPDPGSRIPAGSAQGARHHPPAPQRAGVQPARCPAARRVLLDARAAPAFVSAVGRHRLAAARASRAVRPPRAGRDARHLRLPAGCERARRMEAGDARGIPLGTSSPANRRTRTFSYWFRSMRAPRPTACRAIRRLPKTASSA